MAGQGVAGRGMAGEEVIMVYKFKDGSRLHGDAQAIGEELEQIEERTAENVVDAARRKSSALHDYFEWDDAAAAEAHRLEQARYLLRMVVIVDTPEGAEEGVEYRAYECVTVEREGDDEADQRVYVPIHEALQTPDLRDQVIGRLESTIKEAQTTARKYKRLCAQFSDVETHMAAARGALRSART